MRTFTRISIFLLFLFITSASWSQVVYVNGDYEESVSDGTSWDTPYKTIQEAIDAAQPGDSIWVAKGEYNTPEGSDGYTVDKSLLIFGGFNGTERSFSKREHKENVTSLISGDGTNTRNLFRLNKSDLRFELNGVTITKCGYVILQPDNNQNIKLKFNNCKVFDLEAAGTWIRSNGEIEIDSTEIEKVGSIIGEYYNVQFKNTKIKNQRYTIFQGICNGDLLFSYCQLIGTYVLSSGSGDQIVKIENTVIDNLNNDFSSAYLYGNIGLEIINSKFLNHNYYVFNLLGDRSNKIENSTFYNVGAPNSSFMTFYSDFSIINSSFENCFGNIYGNFNNLKIENSTFKDNKNFYFKGKVNKEVFVNRTTFENIKNDLYNDIFIFEGNGDLTFKESIIKKSDVGQVWNLRGLNGNTQIQNNQILNNKFGTLISASNFNGFTIDNNLFKSNSGNSFVSIISGQNQNFLKIKNSSFEDNTVGSPFGFDIRFVKEVEVSDCYFDFEGRVFPAQLFSIVDGYGNISIQRTTIKNGDFQGLFSLRLFNNLDLSNLIVKEINSTYDLIYLSGIEKVRLKECSFNDINLKPNPVSSASLINCTGADFKINNSHFENISSQSGASVLNIQGASDQLQINNSIFNNCYSKTDGGVIKCFNPSSFNKCSFLNNHSDGSGGAINAFSPLNLNDCIFENNSSKSFGGAIFLYGNMMSINTKFYNNKSESGGVMGGTGYIHDFYNCLFKGNSAKDEPITFVGYNKSNFKNCLFYGNYGGKENHLINKDLSITSPMTVNITNSIIWNNPSSNLSCYIQYSNIQGSYPGKGNLDLDPKFADPENGDFRLLCSSELINKGSNEFASEEPDAYGTPRIFADTVDMGPFEFPGDPNVSRAVPGPDFSFSSASPCINELVAIKNLTPRKEYFTYKWNFGEGDLLTTAIDTSYTYNKSGTYVVKLIATNSCGRSVSTTKEVEVKPSFIPSISYPTMVLHDDTISFSTNAKCSSLAWSVTGGTIQSGSGTNKILVKWGDGASGNGKVKLLATDCGSSNVCEFPVEIDVPIMPAANSVKGKSTVCQEATEVYTVMNRAYVPGAVYTWSAKGGSISGKTSGYGIDSVSVKWGNTVGKGVVYLNITNEIKNTTIIDSFIVQIKPGFNINDNKREFCAGSEYQFGTDISGSFTWKTSGPEHQVEASTGKIKFGATGGSFFVSAIAADGTSFCKTEDTLNIFVRNAPVIDSVVGEREVRPQTIYQYQVYYTGDESEVKWHPLNTNNWISGNPANVSWQSGEQYLPYGFNVYLQSKGLSCISETVLYQVKPEFVYSISGPDQPCVSTSQTYQLNDDPEVEEVFTWKLNGNILADKTNNISVEYTKPGNNVLEASIERNGKTYNITKKVLVDYVPGEVSVQGPNVIKPEGGGTYTYTISNRSNLEVHIDVTGAESHSILNDILTVTWNTSGPYQILAYGTKAGKECTTVPYKLNVSKAPILSKEITLRSGSLCPNTQNTYIIQTDELVEDLRWTLNGGGTIINSDKGFATIQWGENTGAFTLSVTYKRFGDQSFSRSIVINEPPKPQIKDAIVCGENLTDLSTTSAYKTYRWSLEPTGQHLSDQAKVSVNKGGVYTVKVTDDNGCSAIASKNILAVPQPIAKLNTSSRSICIRDEVFPVSLATIEGADYVYQWSADGKVLSNTASTYSFNQDITKAGVHSYKVKATSSGVCTAEDSVTFTIVKCDSTGGNGGGGLPCNDVVSFTVSGYQPFTFENTSQMSRGYKWDFGDGTTSQAVKSVSHAYEQLGTYRVTLQNGCAISAKELKVPVLARFAAPEVICQFSEVSFSDFSVNLAGYPIRSWLWNFGDGITSSEKNPKHIFKSSGKIKVRLTVSVNDDNGQPVSGTFEKDVEVSAAPVIDFVAQKPACNSDLVKFKNNSVIKTSEAIYNWDLGNGLKAGISEPSARYAPGFKQISLEITDLVGCSSSLNQTIEIFAPVEKKPIQVSGNLKICSGDSILLKAPASSTGYVWNNGSEIVSDNSQNIYVKESGSYTVTYSESACSMTTESVEVKVFELKNSSITFSGSGCESSELKVSLSETNPGQHTILWKLEENTLPFASSDFVISSLTSDHAGIYAAIVEEKSSGCEYTVPTKELVVKAGPYAPYLYSVKPNACLGDTINVIYPNLYPNPHTKNWMLDNVVMEGADGEILSLTKGKPDSKVTLKITDNATGCNSTSNVLPIVFSKEIKPRLSNNIESCEQASASISINVKPEDYDFKWYKNGDSISNSIFRMDFGSLSKPDTGYYYAVVISKAVNGNLAGCQSITDTVTVKLKSSPARPEISGDKEFCSGNSVVLQSSVTDNILWSTGETASTITVYEKGVYSVTATDISTGCQSKSTVSIVENPVPDFRFLGTGVYEFCGSEPLKLNGLSAYPSFQWKLNGVDYGKPNKDLYPRKSGSYTVFATTDKGCVGESDTLRVKSLPCACTVVTTEDGLNIGSLRDAINCANSKAGPDNISFDIEGVGPHAILLDSILPVIKEIVVIDGFSQSGDNVYDIIIKGGEYKANGLIQASGVTESEFRGLQFEGLDNAISLDFGNDDNTIEKNRFIGITKQAVKLSGFIKNAIVKDNYFEGTGSGEAIHLSYVAQSTFSNNTIKNVGSAISLVKSNKNTIKDNTVSIIKQNGISLTSSSTGNILSGNTILDIDSSAVLISASDNNTLKGNYIGITKQGQSGLVKLNGIKTVASANTVITANVIAGVVKNGVYTDSKSVITDNTIQNAGEYGIYALDTLLIKKNNLTNNTKGGIFVQNDQVRISQNKITNTSDPKAIDLDAKGNENKLPAEFDTYEFLNDKLVISGMSIAGDTVEVFLSGQKPQQAIQYIDRAIAGADGKWSLTIAKGVNFNPDSKNYYVNTASAGNNTSELSVPFTTGCFSCICRVVNANDAGVGSLRAAVDSAHVGSCLNIEFEIAPTTIKLQAPLRDINVQLNITGKPGMTIDGPSTGSAFTVAANNFNVTDLSFIQWDKAFELKGNNANLKNIRIDETQQPISISGNSNKVGGSCINCNSDKITYPITSGIEITGNNNQIGYSGNSNRIVNAANGVLVNVGKQNTIVHTSILGTQKGIVHQGGGNHNYPAPVNLDGKFDDNNKGFITGKAKAGDKIQVFLSDFSGKPASDFVLETITTSGDFTIQIPSTFTPVGKNSFFILTATSTDGSTSEFSKAVKIGDNTVYCVVSNTDDSGEGSLRAAVGCVNDAGIQKNNAVIVFDLPLQTENIIEVKNNGFVITNNEGVVIDPQKTNVKVKSEVVKLPYAFHWEVNRIEMKGLAFEGFDHAIEITRGAANRIVGNTFTANDTAVYISKSGLNTVSDNIFKSGNLGVFGNETILELTSNTFGGTGNALVSGAHLKNADYSVITWNKFTDIAGDNAGLAKGLIAEKSSKLAIKNNNTLFTDKINSGFTFIEVDSSNVSDNIHTGGGKSMDIINSLRIRVFDNKFVDPSIAGIHLDKSEFIDISKNIATSLTGNAKPIHLNYKLPNESNEGYSIPEFANVTYSHGKVVYKGKAYPESTIEIFNATLDKRDMLSFRGTTVTDRFGIFEYSIEVSPEDINKYTLIATAAYNRYAFEDGISYTSEASEAFNPNLKFCYVTKESDEDQLGTLRYNINLANKNECNLMLFKVDVSGQVNITPDIELPVITTSRLTIDATSQPGYSGAPIVNILENKDFSEAFKINSSGNIFVHGIRVKGYIAPVVVENVNYFENSHSAFEGFINEGIKITSSNHNNIRLEENFYKSETADYIWNFNKSNIFTSKDSLVGGKSAVVNITGDSIVLMENALYGLSGNGFTLLASQSDSLYAFGNKFGGTTSGAKLDLVSNLVFMANDFDVIRGSAELKYGIQATSCIEGDLLMNTISNADTAIVIYSSEGIHCDGNIIDACASIGVVLSGSNKASVSSNMITNTPIGIKITASTLDSLIGNTIFGQDSTGILVDNLSDQQVIVSNSIGAESLTSDKTSNGSGMMIYSSGNLIGGADSLGNRIIGNENGGVLVIKGTGNKITYNVFLNNDYVNTAPEHFAIWHQNNGNELKAKPVIKGVKEVKRNALYVVSGEAEPNDSIHLYRSDGYYQNARFFAGLGIADASGKWAVTVDTSVFERQLIFSTLTIVATATDANNNTSQFSDIAYLGPCYVTSPEDNTDNAYPVPNSFRQAVVCANMQDSKAEIRFFLDNSSGFEIGLQREMIPMDNPFGVSFDGLNLRMEQYEAMKKGLEDVSQFTGNDTIAIVPEHSKEVSDTTVFWRITNRNGRSEFKNLEVYSFDTAFVLKASDSINISYVKFIQIPEYAIVLEEGSKNIYMDSLKLLGFGAKVDSLNRITTFNEGLLYIHKNSRKIVLTNSSVQFAKTGVVINEATNINISDNIFDRLALSVISDKTDSLYITNNTFNRGKGIASAIIADATSANISGNEIANYKYGIPVVVSNSSDVNFSSNNFKVTTDTVNTAVWFIKCDNSSLSGNNFDFVKTSAILIESCDSVLVQENSVQKTKGIGYDIVNSEKTTLSRNLVISKTDSTGQLINIHKKVSGMLSNKSKEGPVIEDYLVQRLKDCKEEKLGIYLYGKSEPLDSIEVFSSDTLITVFKEYITGGRADEAGKWMIRIPEKYYNRKPNYKFSFAATATGKEENNTSQESNTFTFGNVVNELVVKNTKDSGPGSLRQAIEDVNCSDIYSVVYFNIDGDAPYKILLKDSLPAIVATNGFKMDGKTQADYHKLEGIDAEATIYVDASELPDSVPLFVLAADCDSSSMSRMTLLNAAQSIVLNNIGNKLDSLTIRSSLQRRDKAVLFTGGANELSNSVISGYERGVYITGKGNVVRNSVLKDNTISVEVKGEGSNNLVADNNIVSDSISISIRGPQEANFISRNHIGSWDHPLKYPAIKLENASHQYITGSLIPYAEVDHENYETSAFIYIGDSSNYNTLSKNRIGMEKDAKVVMKGNIPGIKVSTELPGQKLLGNSLNRNEIAGLTVPALIMNHVESGIVADNFFGVDSGYVQMNLKSHYKDISGIDTTSVLVMNSAYVTFIGNEMVNFRDHGIDVRNSENISINQNKVYSEYSNQKGIQLNLGTAMESNEGVKAPVIDTNKVISKDRIQISGSTIYPQAEVQIFSGFTPESQDSVLHALRYITSVVSDNDGKWVAELPSNDFGFNKYNKYIAQVNKGLNSSEFSNIYTVKSLLCMLMDVGVDLIGDLYEPCPQSQFKLDAQLEGLQYSWSAPEFDSTLTTRIAQIDKSAHVTLTLKDDFGCELKETFEVKYKEKPEDPIFIVSTNTFVSDTIVLVDVSTTRLDQYDWSSSDGLSIVSAGELATFKGPDGKDYPVGREVRFVAPDTGTYVMTQRSIRDGCFVKLDKEIHVTHKIPGQGNPNVLDPGENNLYVHPSPFLSSEGANIFIETAGEGETEVLILDGLGRTLLTWNVSGKKSYNIPIPKGKLNQGFYIVKVVTVSSSMTFKIEVK